MAAAEAREGSQTFVLKVAEALIYPISNLWNEESNRRERIRRLSIFVGWQLGSGPFANQSPFHFSMASGLN
jgi:hypothetical protein